MGFEPEAVFEEPQHELLPGPGLVDIGRGGPDAGLVVGDAVHAAMAGDPADGVVPDRCRGSRGRAALPSQSMSHWGGSATNAWLATSIAVWVARPSRRCVAWFDPTGGEKLPPAALGLLDGGPSLSSEVRAPAGVTSTGSGWSMTTSCSQSSAHSAARPSLFSKWTRQEPAVSSIVDDHADVVAVDGPHAASDGDVCPGGHGGLVGDAIGGGSSMPQVVSTWRGVPGALEELRNAGRRDEFGDDVGRADRRR